MQLRKRLTALAVALATAAGGVGVAMVSTDSVGAAPPAPEILNNGAQNGTEAMWLETQQLPEGGGVRTVFGTLLVKHAPGRTVNAIRFDGDFNGTDNTGSLGNIAVTGKTLGISGGIETTVLQFGVNVGSPGGTSCASIFGGTRSVDRPVRVAAVDSTGEKSATVTGTVRFVEDNQCLGADDFPRLLSATQDKTNVTPGESISFTFSCDDVDTTGDNDDCDRANVRWRRLDDGATGSLGQITGINDNTPKTVSYSFPSQGHYVLEAQFGGEDNGFPASGAPTGGYARLGRAVVNDPASSITGSIAFAGTAATSPPSINESPSGTTTATATVADAGGQIQAIEWDADGNNVYESSAYTVPAKTGGDIVHPALPLAQRQRAIPLTPGLKTVRVRVTDNGALDGGDLPRTVTISQQLRVNALPVASNITHTVAEDSAPATITLNGHDPDSQPAALTYSLVSGLSNPGLGTLGPLADNLITFTPAPNANGSATFTYRVRDGSPSTIAANGFSNTATVTINVTAVNDVPTADAKTLTTPEDTAGTVLLTGSDVEDGTNLTWSLNPGGEPTNGTASCTAAGLCTYTPQADFSGADSFVVRGTDSGGAFATATVSVTVTPVNDAPVAHDQSVSVAEDSVNAPITLTGSDVDNLVLDATAPLDDVDHGTLTCLGTACTYTPDPDYHGPDSFTFRMSDGNLDSNEATVTIDVTPVNDDPVAIDVPDAVADEDVPTPIAAAGTDVDGDTVTVDSVTDPLHGTTQITGPDEVTYTGDPHFHGVDAYDFTVVDGNGGSDTGSVTVTVLPVNDLPVLADQSFTLDEDTPTLLSIAAGDVDGDVLTWTVTGGPAHGTLVGTGPDVVYSPDADWHGTDTFTVEVDDGNGGTASATITVVVAPVNDAPAAQALSVTTDEDTSVDVTLAATDVDGDVLAFAAPVDAAQNGTVSCTGAACTYTPDSDFHGSDLFTYSVSDGNGGSDFASVTITVTSVNDDPVATGAAVVTDEDNAVAIALTASDVDGDLLTFTYGPAGDGTVGGDGPNVVYTPNPNWFGTDGFGFTVDDGNGGTASAMVSILVQSVNDAPVATGGTVTTAEDTPVSFSLGATDVEGDDLTFSVVTAPADGSLTCDPAGACTFEPDAGFSGATTLEYEVSDGDATGQGVLTILVDPVNDPPEPQAVAVTTDEDTAATFDLTATDPEGDALSYTVVAGPTSGSLVCDAGGSCTYTPAPNASGADSFTWEVSDGNASATSTATITVVPVNDAPTALDVAAETDEDTPVSFLLLATDVEGDALTYSVDVPPAHGSVTIVGSLATYTPAADYSGTDVFVYRVTDPSGASSTAQVSLVVNDSPLIGTSLVGEAAVARVQIKLGGGFLNGGLTVFPNMAATLRTESGQGLAGRTITFTIGGNLVCQAVTGADGVGECAGQAALAALLNLGYQVTFAGDADHAGSTARGPLLQVLSLRL